VTESGLPASMISVTERAVHIAEAAGRITIDYTRKHNGQPVSTTVKAGSTSELPEQWRKLHAQHGGGWKRTLTSVAKYGGDLFLRLLKMITVPLIVTSLVTGVAGLDNTSRFGAMFGRTLAYYGITSMLAITTGLIIVNIVRPGIGAELPGGTEAVLHGGDESLTGILLGLVDNMIPTNPLESLVSSNFLSIITFSIIFAVFLVRTGGENARVLREFFQAAFEVMMRLTMAIISLAPYGVFCFMVYATASQGLAIFGTLAWYMLAVFLALLVHAAITLPLLVKFVAKRSPLEFARAMSPALMTAFSTASSNGTLPLTMTCVEDRAKVSNKVSSFVLPLGATVNMDGTALYEAVAVLFIAQAYRGDLVLADQILVAITALLASVGAAGIPHAGLVMMAIGCRRLTSRSKLRASSSPSIGFSTCAERRSTSGAIRAAVRSSPDWTRRRTRLLSSRQQSQNYKSPPASGLTPEGLFVESTESAIPELRGNDGCQSKGNAGNSGNHKAAYNTDVSTSSANRVSSFDLITHLIIDP
jgi:proton glutamate symport protein